MEARETGTSPHAGAKIIFRSGPLRGNVLALEKERVSLGRDPHNDIAIADSIISGFHAAIVHDVDGTYWLEDSGSKNGTFLNGDPIHREKLKDGDVFYLCQSGPEIQFTLGEPKLPGIIESSTATFARTRSLSKALRELLPQGRGVSQILRLTGVRKILDYQLEEVTRRSRTRSSLLVAAFFLLSVLALAGTLYVQVSGRRGAAGGDPGSQDPAVSTDRGDSGPSAVAAAPVKLAVELEPIYGSLFLSYREHPIGTARIANNGKETLVGCEILLRFTGTASAFLVEPYSAVVPEITAGGSVDVKLTPKLSTAVLSDQTREVTAQVLLRKDDRLLAEESRAIFVHGRHVFSWENPERIAAFVDPEDPAVQAFVRSAWAHRPSTNRQEFPPPNVVGALTVLTGLADLGLRYLPDSSNPISARIDEKATDSINYPGETLLARAGDCDDLSVLSCAVLEAVGIPTALAIGSGHVLFLFDTGIPAAELPRCPLDPATVVVRGQGVWMPVEATDYARPGANFATAWSAAWPRCQAIERAEMQVVELRDAQRRYQPMNPPPDLRTRERIESTPWARDGLDTSIAFSLESLRKLFLENLSVKIHAIEEGVDEGPARDQAIGLLFAQSGLFDKARAIFERAIFGKSGTPSDAQLEAVASNLSTENVVLLMDLALCVSLGAHDAADLERAARYTEVALSGIPDDAAPEKGELMLRLALVHRLRGDLSAERSWSLKAFQLDPTLRTTYDSLVATEGPVAGPEQKVLAYLRGGLR